MSGSNRRFRIPVRRAKASETGETAPEEDAMTEAHIETESMDKQKTEEPINWSDAAMRLRAEMENYRKRQQRLADERIETEKRRLLTSFLSVADNLERIAAHLDPDDPHHRNIQVTYDEMAKLLRIEGVEPINAEGGPFDPMLHEAVAVVPAPPDQDESMVVVEEERKGYRLGDHVLRPTRAVVAKRDQQRCMERYASGS